MVGAARTVLHRTRNDMSTDSSLGEAAEEALEPAPRQRRLPPVYTGEDGATTAGGPNMILLLLTGYLAVKVWRYRRRRAKA